MVAAILSVLGAVVVMVMWLGFMMMIPPDDE
jgi:hypothetical protein